MNLPPVSNNGLMPPHYAPRIQHTLPAQQPGLVPNHLDMSQPNPRDAHFDNPRHPEPFNNAEPFPITTSNVPQGSAQNVNFPSHPFSQIPWNFIWPSVIPPLPDRHCQHTSANQNVQATGSCPTCAATHPTVGAYQFGAGQPAPAVQEITAPSAAASSSSSSSSSSYPTAPHAMPPVSEAPPLLHPGVTDAGPSTSTESAYARKSRRVPPPARNSRRGRREVPLVRIEEHIEWVRRDVMKMTVWFNWSPDAEAEAHEAWG